MVLPLLVILWSWICPGACEGPAPTPLPRAAASQPVTTEWAWSAAPSPGEGDGFTDEVVLQEENDDDDDDNEEDGDALEGNRPELNLPVSSANGPLTSGVTVLHEPLTRGVPRSPPSL